MSKIIEETRIRHIFQDIAKYENNDLKANIKNRLDYNLKIYLLNLDSSYSKIAEDVPHNYKYTIKELTKK